MDLVRLGLPCSPPVKFRHVPPGGDDCNFCVRINGFTFRALQGFPFSVDRPAPGGGKGETFRFRVG